MLFGAGPLTLHMGQHILLMNVAALAAAAVLGRRSDPWLARYPTAAAVAQILLLWFWHAPPVLAAVLGSLALHAFMQASLLLVAIWFWRSLLAVSEQRQWVPVALLLLTSKLFCLLGVLLIFAGRDLYQLGTAHDHVHVAMSGLADQQLAGLLMIVACPLSYLGVGVFLASRWVGVLERRAPYG